ncbi:MAG TPA: ABC transporter ATP-binding protein [Aestuariivirgaceae bacterium]|nr:ABC transporter ATP-binding protein [Aestuariivirgaceae bacterium]
MSDSEPVLTIENLSVTLPKGSDRKYAVEDVSFTVSAREILCIVGESGSGKSVTAQTVMGLLPRGTLDPVAGRVLLKGVDMLGATQQQFSRMRGETMAMIFQEPMTALNPVMRVGDQIAEMLEIHTDLNASQRKARVLEVMADVGLPDPKRSYEVFPHQISGGQRQRVMIAMALVLEPPLLIADEPTTALDVTTQALILDLIKDIQHRHGMAVLFITHDFGVVAEIAHRVAVMQHGRIVETGETAQVLNRPQHAYTRMLMGAVPSLVPPVRPEPETRDIALETRDLVKTYGTAGWFGRGRVIKAVKGVDLTLHRGETVGIVGESGSGKSTVARCIVRLIDPTSGEVLIDGQNIASLSQSQLRPRRRDVQIVFQDPYRSLNPRRTVGQSIVEGPMNFGLSHEAALARAEELMRIVQLHPDVLNRYPHEFSGGQRQRICIARALAMEPTVLVADEPVSALDVSVQAKVLTLLDDVRRQFRLAMLFITHDLRVAAQVCDRILVMKEGEVVEEGDTGRIYADPQHAYTRELMAAVPGREVAFGRG